MTDHYRPYITYAEEIDHLIEVSGLYDGWSIACLNDGSYVNRWEPSFYGEPSGLHARVERVIAEYEATR